METLADGDAGGGVAVAEEKREDVVLSVVARLGDEGEVRGIRAVVGVARAFLVGVGGGKLVAELTGALEHLAGVVGAVRHLWGREARETGDERG